MAITSPRASSRNFPIAPEAYYGDLNMLIQDGDPKPAFQQIHEWVRQIAQTHNRTQQGKTNNIGTVTLATSVTSTTLTDRRISANTIVIPFATTANAASAATAIYQTYPNTTEGQAVLNHDSDPASDRTFAYVLVG